MFFIYLNAVIFSRNIITLRPRPYVPVYFHKHSFLYAVSPFSHMQTDLQVTKNKGFQGADFPKTLLYC